MLRLERMDAIGKDIRQENITELGIPTLTLVKQAVREGRTEEALRLIEYSLTESVQGHDAMASLANLGFTHLATYAEEELEKVYRERYVNRVKQWLATTPGVEESLQRIAESHRGHHSKFTITEERDRYVMRCDPCGSGGRLRRTMQVATMKKAYPWTWGRSGVAVFCTHCSMFMEIIPIEQRGYPIAIVEYSDKPDDPCIHLFYKKPELIPEEYFRRVGKTKTVK